MSRLYISEHEAPLNAPFILSYPIATQAVEFRDDGTPVFSQPLKTATRVLRIVAEDDCMICLVKNEEFTAPGMLMPAGVIDRIWVPQGWIAYRIGVMAELY